MLAPVVIGVGLLLLLIALFADFLGLGESSWRRLEADTLEPLVGVLVVVAGAYLLRRGKVSP
ncbi:MAG TPA: hypothetical protein VEO73_02880 [Gemmatimonadales bacterium]|nr:hypothetical protein [Gemmatimonadales bacterium]